MTTKLLKIMGLVSCMSFLFCAVSIAQDPPKEKAVSVLDWDKKGRTVYKKDCFLACEKIRDEDMVNKCKEKPGEINRDLSGLEEGGCWDQVANANDKCITKCIIGKSGDEAVKAYEVEEYKPVETKAKADADASKKDADDLM